MIGPQPTIAPQTGPQLASIHHDLQIMLGVEQEFDLSDGENDLDFRTLFPHAIARAQSVPFRNCDSAALLEAGYMLACDGKEAEFATAPIGLKGDGPLALAREAIRCRGHMVHLLRGLGVAEIRGYSTHLSVSVPAGREQELAEAIAATVAPALILLMEGRQSPGLLIRPRRGRLEIGSEYIDDPQQLAAAILTLAGAVHAYLFNEDAWAEVPRLRIRRWVEADMRPGIFLPRDAFGESIYEGGRSARLDLDGGGRIRAGEVLAICTDMVLRELQHVVGAPALRTLSHLVDGTGSLQIESERDPGRVSRQGLHMPAAESGTLKMLARAAGGHLAPRFVDWEGAAFAWEDAGQAVILGVPWSHLPALFSAARKQDMSRLVPTGQSPQPVLNSLEQLQTPQAFQHVDPIALGTQALADKGGAKGGGKGGPGKTPVQLEYVTERAFLPPSPVIPGRIPRAFVGMAIGFVVLLVGVIGVLALVSLRRGGSSGSNALPQGATDTPTPVVQGIPALVRGSDTPTPVGQCLPAPVLTSPDNGAIRSMGVELLWKSQALLSTGQTFAVLASTNPNDLQGDSGENHVVGTTTSPNLALDFSNWTYAGQVGNYYWIVRIQDSNGNFADCGGTSPRHFTVAFAVQPTKPPKEGSGSNTGTSGSGGGGGGKP